MIELGDYKKAFLLSMLLNALFFVLFLYASFKKPLAMRFDFQKAKHPPRVFATNFEELEKLKILALNNLAKQLRDKTLLEQGYRKRDLALSLLVSRAFDIERALGKKPSARELVLKDGECLALFPGLNDREFESIISFLEEEKWPLTPQGLLLALKRIGMREESLNQTFYLTPAFQLIEQLFHELRPPVDKKIILALLIDGGYERLEKTIQTQKNALDLSESGRRAILLDYLKGGSKIAAALILRTDLSYALNRLEDDELILLLSNLSPASKLSIAFAKRILNAPRSDAVHKAARNLIAPQNKTKEEVAQRPGPRPGIGELRPTFRERPPAAPAPDVHIVQRGETLASIAAKHQVSQEYLIQINRLASTTLRPGSTLRIPRP